MAELVSATPLVGLNLTMTDPALVRQSSSWFGYLAWIVWSLVYHVVKLVTITVPTFMLTPFSAKWTLTLHATTL